MLSSSCINESNTSCPADQSGAKEYKLNLNIAAENIVGTRAEASDQDEQNHKPQPGSRDENFINVDDSDFCVFILDGSDSRVIQRFEPSATRLVERGDGTYYQLTGSFKPQSDVIRVMVLANCDDFESAAAVGGSAYEEIKEETTVLFSDLFSTGSDFAFTYPADNGKSWVPVSTGEKRTGIPMFGVSEPIRIYPEGTIESGKPGLFSPELEVGPISMLRALAKIEIVNNTPKDDAEIKITSCKLTQYNTSGRFIPVVDKDAASSVNPGWNELMKQVMTPSLPTGLSQGAGKNLQFVPVDADGLRWVAYIPEMDLTQMNMGTGDYPQMEVVVSVDGETQDPYYIELGDYSDGQFNNTWYDNLLRNHWYTFNINNVEIGVSGELYIHVETKNWEMEEDELTYNDLAVEFAENGRFHWTTMNYDQEETLDGEPIVLDSDRRSLIVTRQGGAEGAFTIAEPARGTWTLALYGADDTANDGFHIELWGKYTETQDDGSTVEKEGWLTGADTVSGSIPGEVKFRIVATEDNISQVDYSARLVMSVKTFDDRMMEVNLPYFHNNDSASDSSEMVPPTVDNRGYYTVIQKTSGDFN